MTFLVLLFLLLLYVFVMMGMPGRLPRPAWWFAAGTCAALSGAVVVAVLFWGENAKGGSQIAWIGLEGRRAEDALTLGGSRHGETIGWPSGSFSPEVKILNSGSETFVEVKGGGGFVASDAGFVNGDLLTDAPRQVKDHLVTAHRGLLGGVRLNVQDPSGAQVASIELRGRARERAYSLPIYLTVTLAEIRKKNPEQAASLERWSEGVRVLVTRQEVRVIASEQPAVRAKVSLPGSLRIVWPGLSQPLKVERRQDGRLALTFLPPWRLSSPLPTVASGSTDASHVTLKNAALPGDQVVLIPLGTGLRSFSFTLPLRGEVFQTRTAASASPFAKVLSEDLAHLENVSMRVAVVRDLPGRGTIVVAFLCALLTFCAGLYLLRPRIRERDGWVMAGLALCCWVLLSVRVLLAFRYAWNPAYLDQLSFDGVASALRALAVVPPILLLAARLRRDRLARFADGWEEVKAGAGKLVLGYLGLLALIAIVETFLAHSLWPNVQDRFGGFSLSLSLLFTAGIVTLASLWVLGFVYFLYFYDPEREAGPELGPRLQAAQGWFFFRAIEVNALERGPGLWKRLGFVLNEDDEVEHEDARTRAGKLARMLGLLAIISAALLLVLSLLSGGTDKFIQEVVAPFFICWIPAVIWLAGRLRFKPDSHVSRSNAWWWVPWLVMGVLLVFVPVFLFPIVLRDAGGIVAAVAFFTPVAAILVAGGRPRRLQIVPVLVLLFAVGLGSVAYLNLDSFPFLPGEAKVRLLLFKKGLDVQGQLPTLPLLKSDASGTVTVRQVSQGIQHIWENRALSHEGGWLGLSFGKAPVRHSQIPQHTLQVDSTFSFFILGEHGLAGGLALLLIYAVPLVLVLYSARAHFDLGHGVAAVICGGLLMEALSHAAMNVGAMPYTGRDLPLLAVNSFTDLVRWTLLFSIAMRAIQWRLLEVDEGPELFRGSSLITPPASIASPTDQPAEPWRRFALAALALFALPLLIFSATAWTGYSVIADQSLGRPFQWSGLFAAVRQLADKGTLTFNRQTMRLELTGSGPATGASLIEQEMERFNALTDAEKLEGTLASSTEYLQKLKGVNSLAGFDNLLRWLRGRAENQSADRRPSLFILDPDPVNADEEGLVPVTDWGYRVRPNPAFGTSVSFHELKPGEIPTVSYQDQASGSFLVHGQGWDFRMPDRQASVREDRVITLMEETHAAFRKLSDSDSAASWATLKLRMKQQRGKPAEFPFGEFRVTSKGLTFRPALSTALIHGGNKPKLLQRQAAIVLASGDRVETAAVIGLSKLKPSFSVEKTAHGALAGPAWVMGSWVPAYDPDPALPWTVNLANALPEEHARWKDKRAGRFGTLTIRKELQTTTQEFAARKGREHYRDILPATHARVTAHRRPDLAQLLPPRVAITVLSLPLGEVMTLGSWPRMNSGEGWESGVGGDLAPPYRWVDEEAPRSLKVRYQGDRNFDKLPVGSASKPLWAAAVLQMYPGLQDRLAVRGPDSENQVFGIEIPGKPWVAHPLGAFSGLSTYLEVSDNRYQVRLGFLGIAKPDPANPSGFAEQGRSPSVAESMNNGKDRWGQYPVFDEVDFLIQRPGQMRGLEQSKLAAELKRLFSIGSETGEVSRRRSFWTGDERNDWETGQATLSHALEYTTPEAANFEFNRIHDPRRYISVLLGGATNQWSNADFAGAFATAVLGRPVVPHVTRLQPNEIHVREGREENFTNPPAYYAGLQKVADGAAGTATAALRSTGGLAVLNSLSGLQHYAKTGTLGAEGAFGNVSRVALVLVSRDGKGNVRRGLAISMVVERATVGTASRWLGEYLVENQDRIRSYFEAR
ncbi:MAG: hypothetical protein ABJF23_05375 [Bryobacteraceae bacterium]